MRENCALNSSFKIVVWSIIYRKSAEMRLLRKSLSLCLAMILTVQSTFAFADVPVNNNIVVDSGAPAANQPNLANSANGRDVINIVPPNGSGLSHNKYTNFDVGSNGVILNNSKVNINTGLGGIVIANPKLTGANASIILNEVTSLNPSDLAGKMEVGGVAAEVIIANPNGITCRGCSFINTPRGTLLSGSYNGAGYDLSDAFVTIGDAGIEGDGYVDIIARAIKISGEIEGTTGNNIITGNGTYDYATKQISGAGNTTSKPELAIDGGLLGSIYNGKITVIANELGVGVNLPNDILGTEVVITADGDIAMKKVVGTTSVVAKSNAGALNTSGIINAPSVDLEGFAALNIGSGSLISSTNPMRLAGQKINMSAGKISTTGRLTFFGDEIIWGDGGAITSGGGITVNGYSGTHANLLHIKDGKYESKGAENFFNMDEFKFGDDTLVSNENVTSDVFNLNADPNNLVEFKDIENNRGVYSKLLEFLGVDLDNAKTAEVPKPGTQNYTLTVTTTDHNPGELKPLVFKSDFKTNFDTSDLALYSGDFLSNYENAKDADFEAKLYKIGATISASGAYTTSKKQYKTITILGKRFTVRTKDSVTTTITSFPALGAHYSAAYTITPKLRHTGDLTQNFGDVNIGYNSDAKLLSQVRTYAAKTPGIKQIFASNQYKKSTDTTKLLEVNNRFANATVFYDIGTQINANTELQNITLLGDNEVYQEVIIHQIVQNANATYLENFADDNTMVSQLLTAGDAYNTANSISVNVELNQSQINNLTQDILRLEVHNIDGIDVVVPRVYFAKTGLAATVTAKPIFEVTGVLTSQFANLDVGSYGSIAGGGGTNITVVNDSKNRGVIGDKASVTNLSVGGNYTHTGTLTGTSGNLNIGTLDAHSEIVRQVFYNGYQDKISNQNTFDFTGSLDINTANQSSISGSVINASTANITGAGTDLLAQQLHSSQISTGKGYYRKETALDHLVNDIKGDFTSNTTNALTSQGSKFAGAVDIDSTTGQTNFETVTDTKTLVEHIKSGLFNSKKVSTASVNTEAKGNEFAGSSNNIKIHGDGDITHTASTLKQAGAADMESRSGELIFAVDKNISDTNYSKYKSNGVLAMTSRGTYHTEQIAENSFANGFALTTTSPVQLQVADVNNLPTWAAGNPAVTLSEIIPDDYSTYKKSSTLAPEFAQLVGAGVILFTAGTGSALGAGIATAAGVEGTVAVAALELGSEALVSATLSSVTTNTLNNDGRIKEGLKQTLSKDGRKGIAVATVSGGLTGGASAKLGIAIDSETLRPVAENSLGQRVGYAVVNTASKTIADVGVGGAKVGESLVSNLRSNIADQAQSVGASAIGKNYLDGNLSYAEHKLAHAGVGGASALVSGGNIASGAFGASVAEIAGEAAFNTGLLPKTAVDIAKISGAATGLITGDVTTASNSANIATENNLAPFIYGTIAVTNAAAAGYIAYDIYQTYDNEGPAAAGKLLVKEGLILAGTNAVGATIYKVAGKVYPSVAKAAEGWKKSSFGQKVPGNAAKASQKLLAKNSKSINDLLMPGGKPIGYVKGQARGNIRSVSKKEFDRLEKELLKKSDKISKPRYESEGGAWYRMKDGSGEFGVRHSKDNGRTIDLKHPEINKNFKKIHIE